MTQRTHWLPERWRETLGNLRDDIYEIVEHWLPGRHSGDSPANVPVPVRTEQIDTMTGEAPLSRLFTRSLDIDFAETDDELIVTADVPGLNPDDFKVEITRERLVIRGEKRQESSHQGRGYHYQERRYGAFARAMHLPCEVDADKAKAHYKHGVLRIALPKTESAKAKRVRVKDES